MKGDTSSGGEDGDSITPGVLDGDERHAVGLDDLKLQLLPAEVDPLSGAESL